MATKKCTFKSRSNKSKGGTQNIDAVDLPNIGDTIQLDGDPPLEVVGKNFHINNGAVDQIDFDLA
ncbi:MULTISPECIES: hypothetical protein [Pseudomonas]|jgi:hypothetical protein|uniref:Uncharacterized protein n=1 Tax=Pseudomonas fluorescens TaxID=294 RepID=A0ACD4XVJ3_PSEFL|nr:MULTISPECIES: hypothetical protein [Pseudomonas]PIB41372.1 hypothetical protein AOA57_25995 [Pseudomonas sp. 2588-5]KJZ57733.1 hypothetical protein VC37_05105 [Pseudomonas marginalis]KJZ60878.1 hypothetical protein VC36_05265 [Pseudomonas marginalis]MBZ6458139.1 hypothetical protein [Pseudomonas fluorescens group sp.]MBZ6462245.1 hypothetical protein [Pseudomonas fluorescens group sp.]